MKKSLSILAGGLIALGLTSSAWAQKTQDQLIAEGNFGPKVKWASITEVKIINFQNEDLGRIQGLALDLANGRVVEVLIVANQTLRIGGHTVAVPPRALIPDDQNKVYKINISKEVFEDAPQFDAHKWADSTHPEQIAAAYHYFGQQPYFVAPGEAGKTTVPGASFVHLGAIDSMTSLINMPVSNLKGEHLGAVQTFVLDVPEGEITNVFINAGSFGSMLKFSTIIPPTDFTFNAKHDGLILDDSKVEYADEPRVVFETGSLGENTSFRQQPSAKDKAEIILVQGTNPRDINTTAQIYKSIEESNLDAGQRVEVATLSGRVTLRGPVINQAAKDGITAIAITAVKLANVDNQLIVDSQPAAKL